MATVNEEKEERIISLVEVRDLLEKERAKRELTNEQKMALQHAQTFARLNVTETKKLIKELRKIEKLSDQAVYKLAEILPTHPDDVRVVLAKERYTLEKREVEEIVQTVKKHIE
ncbi:MAG: RNA polymerase Rpb4 family protein [Thermoplasmata archaeon]